jgi:GTPase SAR1 family protein
MIWDTVGLERFPSTAKNYYQDTHIAILVYDITNKASFEEVQNYWIQRLKMNAPKNVSKKIILFAIIK